MAKVKTKELKTPFVYRPLVSDPDRTLRERMNKLSKQTGLRIKVLESRVFEIGISRLEEINK